MTDPVMDFSDAPDQPVQAPARRGRPRSPETLERDERVLKALAEGPKTKEQLVDELNLRAELVYLSLYRLRRAKKVERTTETEARHAWQRTS